MIGRLQCVVLDCADPAGLARFYRALLGGEIDRPGQPWELSAAFSTLHTGAGQVLCFQRVADHHRPQWPDPDRPQQLHLDITVADLDAAGRAVLAAGATRLDSGSPNDPGEPGGFEAKPWRTYADPAGHPFCLVWHGDVH